MIMLQNYRKYDIEKQKELLRQYNSNKGFYPEAVFSDGTELFRSPSEPGPFDTVKIRIRMKKKGAIRVWLHFDERVYMMVKENQNEDAIQIRMRG